MVLRDVTERIEGIQSGTAILVGTNPQKIILETTKLLEDTALYNDLSIAMNPYGDGKSSEKILNFVLEATKKLKTEVYNPYD